MSYIPKDAVTQSFRSNKGVLTPNQIIELDNEIKFTKYGQLELIQTQTASGSGLNIDFTNIEETTYNVHLLILSGIFFAGTNKLPRMRLSNDGGSTFESGSSYEEAYQSMVGATFTEVKSTGQGYFNLINNVGDEVTEVGNSYTYLYNLGKANMFTGCSYHSTSMSSGGSNYASTFGSGVYQVAEVNNAIRIFEATASHNITGTASLYGVRFS